MNLVVSPGSASGDEALLVSLTLPLTQAGLVERGEVAWVDAHDHLVFHLGSSPKFVRHAFERALAAARGAQAA